MTSLALGIPKWGYCSNEFCVIRPSTDDEWAPSSDKKTALTHT